MTRCAVRVLRAGLVLGGLLAGLPACSILPGYENHRLHEGAILDTPPRTEMTAEQKASDAATAVPRYASSAPAATPYHPQTTIPAATTKRGGAAKGNANAPKVRTSSPIDPNVEAAGELVTSSQIDPKMGETADFAALPIIDQKIRGSAELAVSPKSDLKRGTSDVAEDRAVQPVASVDRQSTATALEAKGTEPKAAPKFLATPAVSGAEPGTNEHQLLAIMRAYVANRPDLAVELLQKHYDPANQEMLLALLPVVARLSEVELAKVDPKEIDIFVEQLRSAAALLRVRAVLKVERLCFCREIRHYGDCDPLGIDHRFRPGELTLVYFEVYNFSCDPIPLQVPGLTKSGTKESYGIHLSTVIEIRDAHDKVVWRKDFERQELSQTRRHDHFHQYRFCLPEQMPTGNYRLQVMVTDRPTGKQASRQIPFRVDASPGVKP